ncbi:MAG: hypothetical protein MZV64_18285 [Ignavibacteriales bacterium]|nr:hypothetical protein [Ignavibacteriales bacterium]
MSSSRNMMCENIFHEGGSLFIGAFAEAPGGVRGTGPGRLLLRLRRRPRQGDRPTATRPTSASTPSTRASANRSRATGWASGSRSSSARPSSASWASRPSSAPTIP